MPVDIGWGEDSQQIIVARATGRWTWDELDAALSKTISMMDSVDHTVHFIIDIRGSHLDIAGALGQAQKAATPETHRNEGVKVVVGANWMVRRLYDAYRGIIRAMGKDQVFHFADTPEQARTIIARESAM